MEEHEKEKPLCNKRKNPAPQPVGLQALSLLRFSSYEAVHSRTPAQGRKKRKEKCETSWKALKLKVMSTSREAKPGG